MYITINEKNNPIPPQIGVACSWKACGFLNWSSISNLELYFFNVIIEYLLKSTLIIVKQKKGSHQSGLKTIAHYSGYDHYPLVALNQFRKMNDFIYKRLPLVKCPLLYIHSNNDRVSLSKNIDMILSRINSNQKEKLIVEKAHHHLFYENPDQELILNTIYKFIR